MIALVSLGILSFTLENIILLIKIKKKIERPNHLVAIEKIG